MTKRYFITLLAMAFWVQAPQVMSQEAAVRHNFGDVTKTKLNENFETLAREISKLRAELRAMRGAGLPTGTVIAWDPIVRDEAGRTGDVRPVPDGWRICNGSRLTPDLHDRFLLGAGSILEAGNVGGANEITITAPSGGAQGQTKGARTDDLANGSDRFPFSGHQHSITATVDNRPRFYSVVFLCKYD